VPIFYTNGQDPCPECGQRQWEHPNAYGQKGQLAMSCAFCGSVAVYRPVHAADGKPSPTLRFAPPPDRRS
jgi:hypothetical protein